LVYTASGVENLMKAVITDHFQGMGGRAILRGPNSRATPQSLDPRSKMEEVMPKMARKGGSDAGEY